MAQHVFTGTAAPATTPARVGDHFVNTTAGDLYESNGTSSSANWILIASGGGSTSPVSGSGSPEGVVSRGPGATYLDVSVDPPSLWAKYSGTGNTGWRQLIA